MGIRYCSREDVMSAPDIKLAAGMGPRIDRAIEAASRRIECGDLCNRVFYPYVDGLRFFDWPNRQSPASWRLWLDGQDLIAVTTLVAGSSTLVPAEYFLEPANDGPPYNRVEINLSNSGSFSTAGTHQRAVAITGTWGYTNATRAGGSLGAAITGASDTTCTLSDSSLVGIGDLILVGSEYMQVTGKGMVDSGQNLASNMTSSKADTIVDVANGAVFHVGETVQVEAELMLVLSIAGNNLTVERATEGTVLAAHTSPQDVYVPRTATIVRGLCNTTAATHLIAAPIRVHDVPGPVRQLAVAMALSSLGFESGMAASSTGSGETSRQLGSGGLQALMAEVRAGYRRNNPVGAI